MLFGQSFFSIGLIASFSAAFANPGPKKSPAKLETVETKFPTDSGKVKKPQSKDKKAPLKEIEAEPQKGLRKVTPQPMLKQQPETITPKPDLKIEELKYVDNSRLKKVGVKDYTSLDGHPDLVLYEGWFEDTTAKVHMEEKSVPKPRAA